MTNDYRITLSTNRVISMKGLRIICTDVECDISALHKKYPDLTDEEDEEIKKHYLEMFSF